MIIKLQSTDPARLGKEESQGSKAWISQGRGNTIHSSGGQGASGEGNRRIQVCGLKEENTGKESWSWGTQGLGNLGQ